MGIQNFWETHQNPCLVSDMRDFKGEKQKQMGNMNKFHHWEEFGKLATKTKKLNDVSQKSEQQRESDRNDPNGKIENFQEQKNLGQNLKTMGKLYIW